MYKNTISVNITDPSQLKVLMYAFTWEDRDDFYLLLLDYVPHLIREIIPIDNGYEISWIDESYYHQFIIDDRYNKVVEFLNNFKINVKWN